MRLRYLGVRAATEERSSPDADRAPSAGVDTHVSDVGADARESVKRQQYGSGSQPRTWRLIVAGWRKRCKARGIVVPPRPKRVRRIDYGKPVAWELTDRVKANWTDDELVDALVHAWDRLRPGEELTFKRYATLNESDKRFPSTNTFRWLAVPLRPLPRARPSNPVCGARGQVGDCIPTPSRPPTASGRYM
jgi:hypothetical protein